MLGLVLDILVHRHLITTCFRCVVVQVQNPDDVFLPCSPAGAPLINSLL